MQRDRFPPLHSHPQLEPIQPIQAAHVLAIDEPPPTPQQDPDPQVAKPRSGMGQIANALVDPAAIESSMANSTRLS